MSCYVSFDETPSKCRLEYQASFEGSAVQKHSAPLSSTPPFLEVRAPDRCDLGMTTGGSESWDVTIAGASS